jgi:exopolysaccharide biosynthesis polyprenyl glycosylphosphotransferase
MLIGAVAADAAVVGLAVWAAVSLGFWPGVGQLWLKALVIAGGSLFCLHLADLYQVWRYVGRRDLVARLVPAVLGAAVLTAALGFAVPLFRFGRAAFALIFGLTFVGLLGWRLVWMAVSRTPRLRRRVLVLGLGAAKQLADLQHTGSQPFSVLGILDDAPDAADHVPASFPLLGKSRDLLSLVDELQPELVLVALTDMRRAFPAEDLLECRLRGLAVEDWPTFYEKQTGKVLVTNLRPSWLIFSDGFVKTHFTQAAKRFADLALAAIGLALTLPLMVPIAIAIKLDSRGPALFRQRRVGQNGRIFVLNKFRSMTLDAEQAGAVWAERNDPRVTRVGRWLRLTRLDELPQFFNVLRRDMSVVGPRPPIKREVDKYDDLVRRRLLVLPGITGLWQVSGRADLTWEDSVRLDLSYVENWSITNDLLIAAKTVMTVAAGSGAY